MPAFGWPYQDSPLPGYWGKVNSKFKYDLRSVLLGLYSGKFYDADAQTAFAKKYDYMVTSYVAELINALTSLVYGTVFLLEI
ncbi:MAG: hypothetical protein M1818_007887 [Claussenomyces sp. TS43310]|nr:MAG: hypothetical protein M1818_007887 [Claussenomyces sp. TS43310]